MTDKGKQHKGTDAEVEKALTREALTKLKTDNIALQRGFSTLVAVIESKMAISENAIIDASAYELDNAYHKMLKNHTPLLEQLEDAEALHREIVNFSYYKETYIDCKNKMKIYKQSGGKYTEQNNATSGQYLPKFEIKPFQGSPDYYNAFFVQFDDFLSHVNLTCLLYTSPSPRDS